MTPSQLKVAVSATEPYFLDRKSMLFWGDVMRNYQVRRVGNTWQLSRRRPVRYGLTELVYFDVQTFERVFP